jgi:hypothetical protein
MKPVMTLISGMILEFQAGHQFVVNGKIVAEYQHGDYLTLIEPTGHDPYGNLKSQNNSGALLNGFLLEYSEEYNWVVDSKLGRSIWSSIPTLVRYGILKEVLQN